jgi:glycosyltransferase involved in cell wall biosynthesis
MQVTVANIIPAPFATAVASALLEDHLLHEFLTTYVWKTCPLVERLAGFVPRVQSRLMRRQSHGLPQDKIRVKPFWELTRFAVNAVCKSRYVEDKLFHLGRDSYDKWVASRLTSNLAGVYGFEYGSLHTFRRAQSLGMRRFYDVPSPEHDFVENLLSEEFQHFEDLDSRYRKYIVSMQPQRTEWRRQELELADVVVAASQFTKHTYVQAGVPEAKVVVIPYGAPDPDPAGFQGGSETGQKCRFLWAGTFSVRKGAHYLLEAWRKGACGKHATLEIYGATTLPNEMTRALPDGVKLCGSIARDKLYTRYKQADALLFPTLCDGFGMVATEALSQGLPVVLTASAGAADFITHQENGLIITAGSADAIANAIEWCLDNRLQLQAMRQSAWKSVAGRGWDQYRRQIAKCIRQNLTHSPAVQGHSSGPVAQ